MATEQTNLKDYIYRPGLPGRKICSEATLKLANPGLSPALFSVGQFDLNEKSSKLDLS